MSQRERLGVWRTPSGNSADLYIEAGEGGVRHVTLEWGRLPLDRDELLHYYTHILPDVIRRAAEYLERPGRAAVVVM